MKRCLLIAALISAAGLAQVQEEPVALEIEIENHVLYRGTVFDLARIGREAGPTTAAQTPFVDGINVGDIVAINGKPVKGIWSSSFTHTTPYRSAPQSGQFIADFDSTATFFCTWQIHASDGTLLGMIRDSGAGPGHAITGALGGFFGAIGSHTPMTTTGLRVASTAEDPANRRMLGGGKSKTTLYVYPRFRPAVHTGANGPSVFHSDFSPVNSANPARPGETLVLAATGLGPVKPDLLPPGAAEFTASPAQEVNAPVSVVFNGADLPVTNKIGWPGERHLYRVDFQVPSGAPSGVATLHLMATWIPGSAIRIPVSAR